MTLFEKEGGADRFLVTYCKPSSINMIIPVKGLQMVHNNKFAKSIGFEVIRGGENSVKKLLN
jgi:hypothetical protein